MFAAKDRRAALQCWALVQKYKCPPQTSSGKYIAKIQPFLRFASEKLKFACVQSALTSKGPQALRWNPPVTL